MAAYSGIHSVRFGKGEENPWLDEDMWNMSGGISLDEYGLHGVGEDGVTHSALSIDSPGGIYMPHGSVIEFQMNGLVRLVFKAKADTDWFMVEIDGTEAVGYTKRINIYRKINGVVSLLQSFPIRYVDFSQLVDAQVLYREYQYSADQDDVFFQIGVWLNGRLITAYSQRIGTMSLGYQMGWQVEGENSEFRWNKPYHSVFNIPVEWLTLDPGENGMSAVMRAVGERYIKYFVRADGTLMVLRPQQQNPEWVITHSEISNFQKTTDFRKLVTHVRVWSAYSYSDFVSDDIRKIGRRFMEVNNPNVFTEDEASIEAENIFHVTRAESEVVSMTIPFNPFLEPEDLFATSEGKYFVETFSVEITANSIMMNINGRKYTYAAQ
ncbi:MAG: hypothetical protein HC892_00195 [Saprospiraceae bacterium]|nr:hypothetical protein [Saprospiraceae bacterium]